MEGLGSILDDVQGQFNNAVESLGLGNFTATQWAMVGGGLVLLYVLTARKGRSEYAYEVAKAKRDYSQKVKAAKKTYKRGYQRLGAATGRGYRYYKAATA
jgi:hypothetical protein